MADSPIDWEAIERSPDFRALVSSRRRFAMLAGGATVGLCAAYVVVAYLASGVLGGLAASLILIALSPAVWRGRTARARRSRSPTRR